MSLPGSKSVTVWVDCFEITGNYWPARRNLKRGEPADTPPEPARFEITEIDGYTLADLEERAIAAVKERG